MLLKKSDLNLVPNTAAVLNQPTQPYDFAKDGATAPMLGNVLFSIMQEQGGVGLAANQVGVPVSVFVMGYDKHKFLIFNPSILSSSEKVIGYEEGCLSFPGVGVQVDRPESIDVQYQNEKGEVIRATFKGLAARIFQHEYDHMLGITMKKKVSTLKWAMAEKKRVKAQRLRALHQNNG
jgi:peptide deformylase